MKTHTVCLALTFKAKTAEDASLLAFNAGLHLQETFNDDRSLREFRVTTDVTDLRAALWALMAATGSVRTRAAAAANLAAHNAWVASAPQEQKNAALALARKRDPSVRTFAQAIEAFGSALLREVQS